MKLCIYVCWCWSCCLTWKKERWYQYSNLSVSCRCCIQDWSFLPMSLSTNTDWLSQQPKKNDHDGWGAMLDRLHSVVTENNEIYSSVVCAMSVLYYKTVSEDQLLWKSSKVYSMEALYTAVCLLYLGCCFRTVVCAKSCRCFLSAVLQRSNLWCHTRTYICLWLWREVL